MFGEDFLTCFTIGRLAILLCSLYDKSRMMGDYHVRFCERNGVQFPVPTQHCIALLSTKVSIIKTKI
jgi:hypothetical protein